jgi:hypothetical protein
MTRLIPAENTGGLSSDLWIEAAYQAGRSPAVSSADIVELNPAVHRDRQTARLAAVVAVAREVRAPLGETTCALSGSVAL